MLFIYFLNFKWTLFHIDKTFIVLAIIFQSYEGYYRSMFSSIVSSIFSCKISKKKIDY